MRAAVTGVDLPSRRVLVGTKKLSHRLDESYRSLTPAIAWERRNGAYCYLEYGPGSYAALECAHEAGELRYAHEIMRCYSRLAFDVDLTGELLQSVAEVADTVASNEELVSRFEVTVRRVLDKYYERTSAGELRFVWLDGSREGKLSLHLIVNHAVFYHRERETDYRRQQLKEFYDLFEHEALQSGAFGSLPVSKLFDRGLETGVQLRMLGAAKRDSGGVALRLLQRTTGQPEQYRLHQTLLCWWRREDKVEFERHLKLNERGESMLRPRPPLAIAQLGRREGRERTSAVPQRGEECTDVHSLVDTDQFDAVEEGDDGSLRLNRIAPGYCEQCKREHERDNARIYVRNGCAYYHCFRATQGTPGVPLGRVCVTDDGEDSGRSRFERAEAQRKRDLALVMPGSLPTSVLSERAAYRYVALPRGGWRLLVVCSPMGTGKTSAVIKWLLENRPRRVLMVTSRVVYALALAGMLRSAGVDRVRLYLDEPRSEIAGDGVLIVQVESLVRVADLTGFVVIVDESESVLKQMSSEETMKDGGRRSAVWSSLISAVRHSERVLLMDAFVTSRSVEFVRLVLGQRPLVMENTYRAAARVAVDLESFEALAAKACSLLRDGKRLFVWLASREKAEQLYANITQRALISEKRVRLYSSAMSDAEARALVDVNDAWAKLDCVLCTPAVTVGVSFDVAEHFDHLMVYASSHSCCVRDAMQATMRVRSFRSEVMYYCVYARPPNDGASRPDTVWAIERDIGWHSRSTERLCDRLGMEVRRAEELHEAILRTEALNRLEENDSKRYFRQVWDAYLAYLGYERRSDCASSDEHAAEDERTTTNKVDYWRSSVATTITHLSYRDIPTVGMPAIGVLANLVRMKRASEVEKAQFDRWCFSHYVSGNGDVCARLYDDLWCKRDKRVWLTNLRAEKRGLVAVEDSLRSKEATTTKTESMFVDRTLERLIVVKQLCERLGVQNTGTSAVVVRSVLADLVIPDNLERIMGLRASQGDDKRGEVQSKASIASRALEAWSGARVKRGKRAQRRSKKSGGREDVSDFVLVPVIDGVWEAIVAC